MTLTIVRKGPQALTATVETEFGTSADRVWQLLAVGQIDAILARDADRRA